ncbi:uncharacterized protein LOC121969754 isoform X1 [Zingiber officinale]|nr:uncharacterized protein LOC121969754 isoform X1 [Zingiber officinale]XP_042375924.1 uncharacterized protein LOC121969754 isoform X1 [Zingiber officinale]XP_042375925.1 uncharacterized protein LOC121969754 isoform X1 [Zingiber officinale]
MSDTLNQKGGGAAQEISPIRSERRPKLSIDVPSRDFLISAMNYPKLNTFSTHGSAPNRTNLVPLSSPASAKMNASSCSSSSRGKPPFRRFLSGLSFKFQSSASEIERFEGQAPELYLGGRREKPSFLSSFNSFSKLFSPSVGRTSSLPLDEHGVTSRVNLTIDSSSFERKEVHHISRSISFPVNMKHAKSKRIKRMNSLGGVFRVIPSTPRVVGLSSVVTDIISPEDHAPDDEGENIAEEEAVCRICMIELSEGNDSLKLECSCKGELALAHQECAVKWFSIKGNRNCEVCKQEVKNLPVTLLRIQAAHTATALSDNSQQNLFHYRYWHDLPILVVVSMLAYFCFLEQLLVASFGTAALAIAVPFSCILGLFATLTSQTIVMKEFVWVYAAIQFVLVVFFAHLFYTVLHLQAAISIILATFAGFGVAMSGNTIIVEFLRWRNRWQVASSTSRASQEMEMPSQQVV